MKVQLVILGCVFLSGCATGSVRMIGESSQYQYDNCEVTIYATKEKAQLAGLKEEVCLIEGSSAMSFDHSIEGAIKNNADKVCQCGVNKAYVASAHRDTEMGINGPSHVNLVGFK